MSRADGQGGGRIKRGLRRFRRRSRRQQLLRGGAVTLVVAVLLVVLLVPTSLLGLVVSDSATVSATPAAPSNAALSETGHERTESETVVVRQRISPAGQDRTVVVRNTRRTSERTLRIQNGSVTGSVFVAVASPRVAVAGRPQNPLAGESNRELLQRFQAELDAGSGGADFERVDQREAVMLGQQTTVSVFETNVTVDDQPREVAVYVTSVRHDGDVVVAIGVHPTAFADQRVSVMRLVYSVEHPQR